MSENNTNRLSGDWSNHLLESQKNIEGDIALVSRSFGTSTRPFMGPSYILPSGEFLKIRNANINITNSGSGDRGLIIHLDVQKWLNKQHNKEVKYVDDIDLEEVCIRVNTDMMEHYIVLPKQRPNDNQFEALKEWIDFFYDKTDTNLRLVSYYGPTTTYFKGAVAEDIIDDIKAYYTRGMYFEKVRTKRKPIATLCEGYTPKEGDFPFTLEDIENKYPDLISNKYESCGSAFIMPDGRFILSGNRFDTHDDFAWQCLMDIANMSEQQIEDEYDTNNLVGAFTIYFDLVRVNDGSNKWVEDRAYFVIPKNRISSSQQNGLLDYLDYVLKNKFAQKIYTLQAYVGTNLAHHSWDISKDITSDEILDDVKGALIRGYFTESLKEDMSESDQEVLNVLDETFGQGDNIVDWSTYILPNGHCLSFFSDKINDKYLSDPAEEWFTEEEGEHARCWEFMTAMWPDMFETSYNCEDFMDKYCIKVNVNFPYVSLALNEVSPQQWDSLKEIMKCLLEHPRDYYWMECPEDEKGLVSILTKRRDTWLNLFELGLDEFMKEVQEGYVRGFFENLNEDTKDDEDCEFDQDDVVKVDGMYIVKTDKLDLSDVESYLSEYLTTECDGMNGPVYIFPNGLFIDIMNDYGDRYSIHYDIALDLINNFYNVDSEVAENSLGDVLDYLEENLGLIRCNGGEGGSEDRTYVSISKVPTEDQYKALEKYFYNLWQTIGKRFVTIMIETSGFKVATFEFDKTQPEDIIKAIRRSFVSGQLLSEKNYKTPEKTYDFDGDKVTWDKDAEDYIYWGSEADKWAEDYAKSYKVQMSPKDFLDLTTQGGANSLKKGDNLGFSQLRDLDKDEFNKWIHQPIFLQIAFRDKNHPQRAQVTGHEGRHRMFALMQAGYKLVDVELSCEVWDTSYDKYHPFKLDSIELIGQFNPNVRVEVYNPIPLSWKQHKEIRPNLKDEKLEEKIVKLSDGKYQVQSEKGRNLGTYDSKKEAEDRLKQVEYFKHMNEDVDFDLSSDDFEEWCFDNMLREINSTDCSSYFIFPDGEVFGTPSTHDDMIGYFFEDNDYDEDIYKYLQYLVTNQGVIRCTGEDYEHYVQLPSKGITQPQYKTLTEWLDYYSAINEKVQIMIKDTNFNHKIYSYKENTVDDIIKKIKRLYTTGVLVDSFKHVNEDKEDYQKKFDERTHAHIDRVNKYAKKINKEYPHHDEDKFNELYDGYSLMSKNKEDITKEEQSLIDDATFKHIINNEHHCEHWVDPKDVEGFSRDNPTPHGCLDCSKMPKDALEEMCCDWCAMSEEFNNTPFEWYEKNKDTRWHFNEEQDKFILDTLHKLWDSNQVNENLNLTKHCNSINCKTSQDKNINESLDEFDSIVKTELDTLNRWLDRYGFEAKLVTDEEELDYIDWTKQYGSESVGMFLQDLQDNASVFPIALNKKVISKLCKDKYDLIRGIKGTLWHEAGHGIYRFLEDTMDMPEDEEDCVEEFARYREVSELFDILQDYMKQDESLNESLKEIEQTGILISNSLYEVKDKILNSKRPLKLVGVIVNGEETWLIGNPYGDTHADMLQYAKQYGYLNGNYEKKNNVYLNTIPYNKKINVFVDYSEGMEYDYENTRIVDVTNGHNYNNVNSFENTKLFKVLGEPKESKKYLYKDHINESKQDKHVIHKFDRELKPNEVVLYHQTSEDNLKKILKDGFIKGDVWAQEDIDTWNYGRYAIGFAIDRDRVHKANETDRIVYVDVPKEDFVCILDSMGRTPIGIEKFKDEFELNESKQDIEKFRQWAGDDLANRFFNVKQRLDGKYKDIYYYMGLEKDTFERLIKSDRWKDNQDKAREYAHKVAIESLTNAIEYLERTPTRKEVDNKGKEGAEKVYEDDRWLVLKINTYEASVKYGKHTEWCITGTNSQSDGGRADWENHEHNDMYFYIDKKNNHKYALEYADWADWVLYSEEDYVEVGKGIPFRDAIDALGYPWNPNEHTSYPAFPKVEGLPDLQQAYRDAIENDPESDLDVNDFKVESLNESKADWEKFKQWCGDDSLYNRFMKLRPRLANIKFTDGSKGDDIYFWMKHNTPIDLEDTLQDLESTPTKKEREERAQEGAKLLYNQNGWKVYKIETQEASQKYGKGSMWCISGEGGYDINDGFWNGHEDCTYFFIHGNEKYALIWHKGNKVWDIWNDEDEIIPYIPNAPKVEGLPDISKLPDFIAKNVAKLYDISVDDIKDVKSVSYDPELMELFFDYDSKENYMVELKDGTTKYCYVEEFSDFVDVTEEIEELIDEYINY